MTGSPDVVEDRRYHVKCPKCHGTGAYFTDPKESANGWLCGVVFFCNCAKHMADRKEEQEK